MIYFDIHTKGHDMLTIKNVNKTLAQKFDNKLELVKGNGYFYFAGELASEMKSTGLYGTPLLNAYTIDQIVKIAENRISK